MTSFLQTWRVLCNAVFVFNFKSLLLGSCPFWSIQTKIRAIQTEHRKRSKVTILTYISYGLYFCTAPS